VVLVVDDGKQHVMLLRLALMQRGYAVIIVHTPEGAQTMLRERSVDALIVTLVPASSAAATLASLGESRPRVTVALADTTSDPAYASFDVALPRPVDFGELDIALRHHMKRHTSGTRARVKKQIAS
jgi:DNA-binding response OmpR family regulator